MSAYNTVVFPWKDPKTNQFFNLQIQFKYGEVWQHEYKIGDLLSWGSNEVGDPSARKVVVEGILEGEKLTEIMPEDFQIYVVENRITSVVPIYRFIDLDDDYLVLE